MEKHHAINYVEFASRDLPASKKFFETVFGWKFTDYGDAYTSFESDTIYGGFYASDKCSLVETGACLVVIHSNDLEKSQQSVVANGGAISREIFSFPGGRRFHFIEPGGNELSVWGQ